MEAKQMFKEIHVSAEKGAPERTILLTVEMDLDEQQVMDLAFSSLVITWQGKQRKRGDAHLKAMDGQAVTVKASEIVARSVRTPLTPAEMAAKVAAMPNGAEKDEAVKAIRKALGF
jgi:hypothetical protein